MHRQKSSHEYTTLHFCRTEVSRGSDDVNQRPRAVHSARMTNQTGLLPNVALTSMIQMVQIPMEPYTAIRHLLRHSQVTAGSKDSSHAAQGLFRHDNTIHPQFIHKSFTAQKANIK